MICQHCNLPFPMLFVMVQTTGGAQQKLICFPCLTALGEKMMAEWKKACPTCKEPVNGDVQGAVRWMNTCAKGHQW